MPRVRRQSEKSTPLRFPKLVRELVTELKNSRAFGQPYIEEQVFPRTNAMRINVVWDKWERVSDEDRADTIHHAYEQVEGKEFSDRIALAIGLTVPEAVEMGVLPFQIAPMLRKDDSVTLDQCRTAMIALGASTLHDPEQPQLRFATREEAEACVQQLSKQLPGSGPVWLITHDTAHVGC
jgi:hypothetical protein